MKKQIIQALVVFGGLFFLNSISEATIVGSSHDFTPDAQSTFTGTSNQVCIYCHTPHGGNVRDRIGTALPLWNRTLNETASFTMYGGDSATFDGYVSSKPTGPSLLCLSCHDGVTTIGGEAILKPGAEGTITVTPEKIGDLNYPPWADVNIGRDLSDDHPVSFEYNDTLVTTDGKLKDPNTVLTDTPLKLYGPSGKRLECSTCHDPHEYGIVEDGDPRTPFLRMTNARSDMCRACHLQ